MRSSCCDQNGSHTSGKGAVGVISLSYVGISDRDSGCKGRKAALTYQYCWRPSTGHYQGGTNPPPRFKPSRCLSMRQTVASWHAKMAAALPRVGEGKPLKSEEQELEMGEVCFKNARRCAERSLPLLLISVACNLKLSYPRRTVERCGGRGTSQQQRKVRSQNQSELSGPMNAGVNSCEMLGFALKLAPVL